MLPSRPICQSFITRSRQFLVLHTHTKQLKKKKKSCVAQENTHESVQVRESYTRQGMVLAQCQHYFQLSRTTWKLPLEKKYLGKATISNWPFLYECNFDGVVLLVCSVSRCCRCQAKRKKTTKKTGPFQEIYNNLWVFNEIFVCWNPIILSLKKYLHF